MTAAFLVTSWIVWAEMALCAILAIPYGTAAKISIVNWVSRQSWCSYLSVCRCPCSRCGAAGMDTTTVFFFFFFSRFELNCSSTACTPSPSLSSRSSCSAL
jgi:hypothetical protein